MKQLVIIIFLFFLGGCASPARIDYDRQVSFPDIKTFQWQACEHVESLLWSGQLMDARLKNSITSVMQSKNLSQSDEASDVVIKGCFVDKQEVEQSGVRFGIGWFKGPFGLSTSVGTNLTTADYLALVINVYSPKDERLIWRGSFQRRVNSSYTPEYLDTLVQELVSEILSNFPPTKKNKD